MLPPRPTQAKVTTCQLSHPVHFTSCSISCTLLPFSVCSPPVSTPGLQKKRALRCQQLFSVFYLCTPCSWIKTNSFPPLVFTYPQDLYLNWSKAQAWLRLTQRGEVYLQVGKGGAGGVTPHPLHTGQAGNKQQTCREARGSCAMSPFPAAEWVRAIWNLSLQSQASCARPFTLYRDCWAAAAIVSEVHFTFHIATSYSSLHTLLPSLWPQPIANPVPSLSSKQKWWMKQQINFVFFMLSGLSRL